MKKKDDTQSLGNPEELKQDWDYPYVVHIAENILKGEYMGQKRVDGKWYRFNSLDEWALFTPVVAWRNLKKGEILNTTPPDSDESAQQGICDHIVGEGNYDDEMPTQSFVIHWGRVEMRSTYSYKPTYHFIMNEEYSHRFQYCPRCGTKIDWEKIKESLKE